MLGDDDGFRLQVLDGVPAGVQSRFLLIVRPQSVWIDQAPRLLERQSAGDWATRLPGVLTDTTEGRTRFHVEPHLTTDDSSWSMRTQEFNRRYLSSARSVRPSVVQEGSLAHNEICLPNATCGRAQRGSRKQLQDYVSDFEADLTSAVMEKLPTRLKDLGTNIRWVSPLALDNFVEYRDRDFLRAVGLGEFTSTLD